MTNSKKKKFKKAIARCAKVIQNAEEIRIDQAWKNLFMQTDIMK
ncbi:DUF3983 domain-containing protein [Bacillus cereus]|nr:DUF3983 domain-containing protein [Bacillus cereus]